MTTTCVDCGSPDAVVTDPAGRLCLPCQRKRNDNLAEIARTLGAVCQPIDPDGPPMACGMKGCSRDATTITRLHTDDGLIGVTACDQHIPSMAKVVAKMMAER